MVVNYDREEIKTISLTRLIARLYATLTSESKDFVIKKDIEAYAFDRFLGDETTVTGRKVESRRFRVLADAYS